MMEAENQGPDPEDVCEMHYALANCIHGLSLPGYTAFLHTFLDSIWLFSVRLRVPCE